MKQLIIKYPVLIISLWVILNIIHCCLNLINSKLYKEVAEPDVKFKIKYNIMYFLKLLLWLAFGILILITSRNTMLNKDIITREIVWYGALFFLIIGLIIRDLKTLGEYIVYWRKMPKTFYSVRASMIVHSFEFFGYAIIMFLSCIVSQNAFLCGGALGFFGLGIVFLMDKPKCQ
ncbi:MAG: hypothetical protein BWY69_00397 [Planctomycetes bacterium ADurb.Bin401]|nr:MAG: hypothetical protein BWY69_00397 [Planctomycetes bacterium ADurb.Bin401]